MKAIENNLFYNGNIEHTAVKFLKVFLDRLITISYKK